MAACQDKSRPIAERVEAFDSLLDTFTKGTSERTIDRFVGSAAVTQSRIAGPPDGDAENWAWTLGGTFSLRLVAPDGSDRWITLHDNRVAD